MSVLRTLEEKIAGLVEGTFGRVFKAEVKPVELAHRLEREMDAHRTVSLSRTYVPYRYVVWLSPEDRARYSGMEAAILEDLSGHLLEYARREQLVLAAPPQLSFDTDEALELGEFGIETKGGDEVASAPPAVEDVSEPSGTMVYSSAARHQEALTETPLRGSQRAVLEVGGRRIRLPATGATIGRSRDCDVTLHDSNVSRHHAEIVATGSGWAIRDLGSTNGLKVNGRAVGREPVAIAPGDALMIGTLDARFESA